MRKVLLIKVGRLTIRPAYGPPLGVMYLASYLRKYSPEVEVRLVDMLLEGLSMEDLLKMVAEYQPDLLGISAVSFEAREARDLAAGAKKLLPQLPIVIGGAYVTNDPNQVFTDLNLDFVVRREGEKALLELVNCLFFGRGRLEDILGLGFRRNGQTIMNPNRPFEKDLDSLPFPAWDLLPIQRYFDLRRLGVIYTHREYMYVLTSRGCPYHCTYCTRNLGLGFRPRSPENVIEELEILYHKYGIREINFLDDCFNANPARAKHILDLIVERGLKFSINFCTALRGDVVDEELLDKLKAAGTFVITYPVESANERVQKFIKKNLNLEKVKKAIELTDKKGMLAYGFFIIGFPGETRREIEQTMEFALKSRLHSVNIFFATPFEGTELYQQAKDLGYQVALATDSFNFFLPQPYDICEVPGKELARIAKRTFLKFYLNPRRLWRIFLLLPKKKQIPGLLWLVIKYSLKWS